MTEDSHSEDSAIGDNNNFSRVFGEGARSRILYVMFFFHDQKLTKTRLADEAGVSRPTVYDHVPKLIEMGIINESEEGRVWVNKDSELAQTIAKMEWDFIDTIVEAEQDGPGVDEYLARLGDEMRQ